MEVSYDTKVWREEKEEEREGEEEKGKGEEDAATTSSRGLLISAFAIHKPLDQNDSETSL